MKYKNLYLTGTSHIAEQSLKDVECLIKTQKPDVIAIELDKKRYYALLHNQRRGASLADIRYIGFKGYIFSLIAGWAQKKLGEYVNVEPGSEMLTAIKLAKKEKIPIELIDQDIEITLKRFSKELTWKEKWNFIADLFKGFVLRKKEIEFDLRKVPDKDLIFKLIKKVKKRYPSIYKVLVEERDHFMARKLFNLMRNNPDKRILAFVGAGHEEGIIAIMKRLEESNVEYRLSYGV